MLTIVYSRDENLPLLANFSYIKFIHYKVLQAESDFFSFFFFGRRERTLTFTTEINSHPWYTIMILSFWTDRHKQAVNILDLDQNAPRGAV